MKFIEIDLDGLVVRARLNEDRAPKTSQAVWEALPFEGKAVHAQISGEMFRMLDQTPVGDLEVENAEYFQHPGQIVYFPPIKEIAFCVGSAQFAAPQGEFALTPLGEIEGDFSAWAKKGDDLQYTGTKPIRFRKAADQTTPFRYPTLDGQKIAIDFDGVQVMATLLSSSKTAAAVGKALPLSGRASNSTWAGSMTRFIPSRAIAVDGQRDARTTFHWPGYVYLDERDGSLRIGYGDCNENVQNVSVPLIPIARIDGDLSAYQQKARSQLLEGVKPMTITLADQGQKQTAGAAAGRAES